MDNSIINVAKRYFVNSLQDYDGIQGQGDDEEEEEKVVIDGDLVKKRIKNLVQLIKARQSCTSSAQDCDGGPYVGLSGVSFMFWHLAQQKEIFGESERSGFLDDALSYLKPALEYAHAVERTIGEKVGKVAYLLGNAGTYAVATLVFSSLSDAANKCKYLEKYLSLTQVCLPQSYLAKGSDELLVGRAGYVCGALFLNKTLNSQVISNETLINLGVSTINSGRAYSAKRGYSNCPLMYSYYETEYVGAAHGVAGILQVLLQTPNLLQKKPDYERDVKSSVDFVLSLQTLGGNFPCALDELYPNARSSEEELVHWCHGAPGVVWLMAKAYLLWKEEKYLNACIRCADLIWRRGILRKGSGICHGVAGNAYVFLLMYKLTQNPLYLHRANKFQEFMFTQEFREGCRTPDSPYSLYEGFAGTVCFLTDLLQPQKVQFPLYCDIFHD